jgi:hypothetical protein
MYEAIQSKDWEQGYNSEYRVSYLLESSSEEQQSTTWSPRLHRNEVNKMACVRLQKHMCRQICSLRRITGFSYILGTRQMSPICSL